MGALVLALTLGIMVRSWLSPMLRVPYTVLVLIVGLAVGFIAYTEERTTGSDIFSRSVGVWLGISPEAILNGGWGGTMGGDGWEWGMDTISPHEPQTAAVILYLLTLHPRHMRAHTHIHPHPHIHTYTHIHTHTHTHTHTHRITTVILPILIFGSSFAIELHLFLKQIVPVRSCVCCSFIG